MKNRTKRVKKFFIFIFIVIVIVGLVTLYADWKITADSKSFVYDKVDSIPPNKVALVLGTAKKTRNGQPNLYFKYRMDATKELYDAGKVKAFVVSGDNGNKYYNEPEDMRDAMVALGIPDSIIYHDYAGFRTLDSVIRMTEIFGQTDFIIVSQKFHNERAVFLAHNFGCKNVYGYNARDIALNKFSIKTVVREKFARVKALLDCIFNKKPKFLGDPIKL